LPKEAAAGQETAALLIVPVAPADRRRFPRDDHGLVRVLERHGASGESAAQGRQARR
jgi:hypothetical protein